MNTFQEFMQQGMGGRTTVDDDNLLDLDGWDVASHYRTCIRDYQTFFPSSRKAKASFSIQFLSSGHIKEPRWHKCMNAASYSESRSRKSVSEAGVCVGVVDCISTSKIFWQMEQDSMTTAFCVSALMVLLKYIWHGDILYFHINYFKKKSKRIVFMAFCVSTIKVRSNINSIIIFCIPTLNS